MPCKPKLSSCDPVFRRRSKNIVTAIILLATVVGPNAGSIKKFAVASFFQEEASTGGETVIAKNNPGGLTTVGKNH